MPAPELAKCVLILRWGICKPRVKGAPKDSPQAHLCNNLLAQMYVSVAEPLLLFKYSEEAEEIEPPPDPANEPSQKLADNEGQGSIGHASLGAGDVNTDGYRRARDLLGDWSPGMNLAEIVARKPEDLPVRHLPLAICTGAS